MLDSSNIETTDIISELVQLGEFMRTIAESNSPSYEVLAAKLGLSSDSAEFCDIVSAIVWRTKAAADFIKNVEDRHVSSRSRNLALTGLASFSAAFFYRNIAAAWAHNKNQYFNDTILGNMESFIPVSAKYRPLRLVSRETQQEFLVKIDELAISVSQDKNLPPWSIAAVCDSLGRLKMLIQYLAFFGHEHVLNEVVLIDTRLHHLHRSLIEAGSYAGHALDGLLRVAETVVVVGHLLCLPAEAPHAYHWYRDWISGPVTHQVEDDRNKQKLLEGPKKTPHADSTETEPDTTET